MPTLVKLLVTECLAFMETDYKNIGKQINVKLCQYKHKINLADLLNVIYTETAEFGELNHIPIKRIRCFLYILKFAIKNHDNDINIDRCLPIVLNSVEYPEEDVKILALQIIQHMTKKTNVTEFVLEFIKRKAQLQSLSQLNGEANNKEIPPYDKVGWKFSITNLDVLQSLIQGNSQFLQFFSLNVIEILIIFSRSNDFCTRIAVLNLLELLFKPDVFSLFLYDTFLAHLCRILVTGLRDIDQISLKAFSLTQMFLTSLDKSCTCKFSDYFLQNFFFDRHWNNEKENLFDGKIWNLIVQLFDHDNITTRLYELVHYFNCKSNDKEYFIKKISLLSLIEIGRLFSPYLDEDSNIIRSYPLLVEEILKKFHSLSVIDTINIGFISNSYPSEGYNLIRDYIVNKVSDMCAEEHMSKVCEYISNNLKKCENRIILYSQKTKNNLNLDKIEFDFCLKLSKKPYTWVILDSLICLFGELSRFYLKCDSCSNIFILSFNVNINETAEYLMRNIIFFILPIIAQFLNDELISCRHVPLQTLWYHLSYILKFLSIPNPTHPYFQLFIPHLFDCIKQTRINSLKEESISFVKNIIEMYGGKAIREIFENSNEPLPIEITFEEI
ncbi:hypothetical protein HZS_1613 [Henneguya salminicola]|nr:hypothetical protein HZS_1613 [Henneguya salminicola]